MKVVSNTSPLTNLAAIGKFELLYDLFEEIRIPEGVWRELNAKDRKWPGQAEVASAEWVKSQPVMDEVFVKALQTNLDRGEAETIALAIQIGAEIAILDEKEGRHAAQRLGLKVIGVLGILLLAKSKGLIPNVRPFLDSLRHQAGFYLADSLAESVLESANE